MFNLNMMIVHAEYEEDDEDIAILSHHRLYHE